jgi:hypothetical protein
VLKRISGHNRNEVIGGWRKLHNEELRITRMIKSKRIKWEGRVGRRGRRMPTGFLGEKPHGKRPLGRPRHRWNDNIKKNLRGTRWAAMYWTDLAQVRDQYKALVNKVMNLRVPHNSGKFVSGCESGVF